MTTILAPISVGELIDKMTILRIKLQKITDAVKQGNIGGELEQLAAIRTHAKVDAFDLASVETELFQVNLDLWHVEDELRELERNGDFGGRFVELARSVYRLNDRRSALKRRINEVSRSAIVEEKSYTSYG